MEDHETVDSKAPASVRARRALMRATGRLVARFLQGRSELAASVVIATQDRATYLNLTLAALERQSFPEDAWEVVVGDSGSRDETAALLDRFESRGHLRMTRASVGAGDPSRALNQALAMARGSIVVLLGDDRLVAPDFLARHLLHHLHEPCVVLGDSRGCVHTHLFPPSEVTLTGLLPEPVFEAQDLDHPDRWSRWVVGQRSDYRPLFAYFDRRSAQNPFPWVHFDAGNASVSREALLQVRGFTEGFAGWNLGCWGLAGQEVAYRLHRAGFRFRFEPRAQTLRQLSLRQPLPRSEQVRNLCCLFSKHPELSRSQLEPILLPSSVSI